jgi:2-C-methyl-D-erythritol 4-phosphate cytidylyltransferase/2-C-methyl-D-erythritol 2,4-cyclodiphosphate synthase
VLVHDGARPLVTPGLVDAVASAAVATGAAIPTVAVAETLKRVAGGLVGETVDRSGLAADQTPQAARRGLLERAWSMFPPSGPREFTDEAALLEAAGIPVASVPGDAVNLKVTVPEDLARAEAILAARLAPDLPVPGLPVHDLAAPDRAGSRSRTRWTAVPPRVGHGADEHPFGEETGLALGGIVIDGAPRLRGHSDGDVALHAVADALLGAAGLGDLGRFFPAGDPATRGIPSGEMLRTAVQRLADAGWRPASADVTIRAGRPRLGGARLDAMRAAIALLLGLPEGAVQVKASSGNLVGFEGAGRGIAATAVATVVHTMAWWG